MPRRAITTSVLSGGGVVQPGISAATASIASNAGAPRPEMNAVTRRMVLCRPTNFVCAEDELN